MVTCGLPSLLGLFLFMFPFSYRGTKSTLVAHLATAIEAATKHLCIKILLLTFILSACVPFVVKAIKKREKKLAPILIRVGDIPLTKIVTRILAATTSLMVWFQIGPNAIIGTETGQEVLYILLPKLAINLALVQFLVPLIFDFGLMAFLGRLLTSTMRRLFRLPGSAATNCITSWLGDGTLGVMIALRSYQDKKYTAKETAIVITCFSAVSITFCTTLLAQANLLEYFPSFYFIVVFSSLIAALILPRIPPLSSIPDTYAGEETPSSCASRPAEVPRTGNTFCMALIEATEEVSNRPPLFQLAKRILYTILSLGVDILPGVMTIATLSLILANNTPIFAWLGAPFIPILRWCNMPDAEQASQALFVGFADMLIPSLLVRNSPHLLTRFTITALSVTQIIYLSELGSILVGGPIKEITWVRLLYIFVLRTLITLPIIFLFAKYLI